MRRLSILVLLVAAVVISCQSKEERAQIEARKAYVATCNMVFRKHGLTNSKMKTKGANATTAVLRVARDEEPIFALFDEGIIGEGISYNSALMMRGFKKSKTWYPHTGWHTDDLTERKSIETESSSQLKDYMGKEVHDSILEEYMDAAMELPEEADFVELRRLLKETCNEHGYTLKAYDEAGLREAEKQLEEAEREGLLPGQ